MCGGGFDADVEVRDFCAQNLTPNPLSITWRGGVERSEAGVRSQPASPSNREGIRGWGLIALHNRAVDQRLAVLDVQILAYQDK